MKTLTRILLVLTSALALSTFTGCAGGPTAKSTGEFIDDATITGKVKASMIADPVVKAFDVGVDTYKGTVQLNGFVDTAEQKARAEQIARGVAGVVEVQNRLGIKSQAAAPAPPR